jgi:hypothetical protein
MVGSVIAGGTYLAEAGPYALIPAWAHSAAAEPVDDTAPVSPRPAPTIDPASECDVHYPGLCIPPVSYNGDMECDDLMAQDFRVLPGDPHGLDVDNDGIGCEQP